MPQKRGRSASPPGSKRRRAGVVGNLNTIPYINNDVLRKNLNLALSKADSRHDFDFNIAHNYLLTFTLNHLYGEAIAINDGNSYTDYTHDTDPFTKAINAHVHSYQVRGNFLIQDSILVWRIAYMLFEKTSEMLLAPVDTTLSSDDERKEFNVDALHVLLKKYKMKPMPKE